MSEQVSDTPTSEALTATGSDDFGGKLKVTITHHLRIPKSGKCTYFNADYPEYRWFILPFYDSDSAKMDDALKYVFGK